MDVNHKPGQNVFRFFYNYTKFCQIRSILFKEIEHLRLIKVL